MKTPNDLINDINRYTHETAILSEMLVELNKAYATWWEDNRPEFTSDKQAEKSWDLTKSGIEMMEVKTKIKVKERRISAAKMTYRHMENEARNLV